LAWNQDYVPACSDISTSVYYNCKVSFKSNEPFRRSCAYKPISPYRTYFRV
jgi:hypothetical protein